MTTHQLPSHQYNRTMDGSLALVGSGEYLPAMTSFAKSPLEGGIKNGKAANFI